jgi:hypothetical protein
LNNDYWGYLEIIGSIREDLQRYSTEVNYSEIFSDRQGIFNFIYDEYHPDTNRHISDDEWFKIWIALGRIGLENGLLSKEMKGRLSDIIKIDINTYKEYAEENEFDELMKDYRYIKLNIDDKK